MEKTNYFKPRNKFALSDILRKFKKEETNLEENPIEEDMKKTSFKKGLKFDKKSLMTKLGAGGGITLGVVGVLALLVFLFIVKPAYAVLDAVNDLKKDSKDLQEALIIRDLDLFNEKLDEIEEDFNNLSKVRDNNFGWAAKFGPTKGYYTDTDHFVAAGKHAVAAGREFGVLITPFAEALGFTGESIALPEGHSGLADAVAGWIGVMPAVAENMDGIILEMTAIGEEMEKVDASRYPKNFMGQPLRSMISGAQSSLVGIDEYGPDIKKALEILPTLLGVNAYEQRYAIIMQNDKEIRATGGFWTNYATFKVNNAMLTSDFTSKDMYSIDFVLDAIDAYHTFPKVPPMYEKYLKVERMYARDANISPDFPTAIDQWMYFYDLGQQVAPWEIKPVEGVIAMDTQVVKELLEVTGPVTVNGVTFSEDNVVLELEKIASLSLAEQSNRKKVLGDLMEGMLINVYESDSNLWPKLVEKGVDLIKRKHILVMMFDEEAQTLLDKYNFSGRIVDPVEGDYVYANQTNLGGDKTNMFVNKHVLHKLEKEDNRWVRTVEIEYTYTPKGGEYAQLEKRFQDWMRLYVPAGSEIISLEGSMDPVGEGEERGKTYFHGFTGLGPNETTTMKFKYYLPDGVVTGDTYNLYIQKQAGIDMETHTVIVNGTRETIELDMDKKVSLPL